MKATRIPSFVLIGVFAFQGNVAISGVSPRFTETEIQERRVDQAALDSQLNAIRNIKELLAKNRGKGQEPALLYKLGEAQRRAGGMQFRIAHGTPRKAGSKSTLDSHKPYLVQATKSFGELIKRFSNSTDLPRAYFLKAKSHADAGEISRASSDYMYLIRHYPKSEDTVSAHMAVAEFEMSAGRWEAAADHLRAVERKPDHPYFPHALYRAAWCHYNLRDVARALSYIERTIRFYANNAESASDEALRENAVQDAALFFLLGFEQKLSNFGIEEAYTYFKRLESGALFGKTLIRYAKLLRAHGHVEELGRWKTLVLAREPERPESLELIVIAYEDQLNKRQYSSLVSTARELVAYRTTKSSPDSVKRAEKLLLDAASQLQQLISRNKNADGVAVLTTALAGIYESFTRLVSEDDPRVAKVHFNLAESLFEIGQYAQATDHYRRVLRDKWDADASLRAIGSRYEELRKSGIVPKDLKARSLSERKERALDPKLSEWIAWVDEHASKSGKSYSSNENFYFEANRCIYVHGDLGLALARLHEFALKFPASKYAIPSATLVVDTYVASSEWQRLQELASELLQVKEWKESEFAKRLYSLASDADFKAVEAAYRSEDYKSTVSKAEQFMAKYPQSKRGAESLSLAGHAALAMKDTEAALGYFSKLQRSAPGSERAASALLAEAAIREEQLDLQEAARGYRSYLALPSGVAKLGAKQKGELRGKTVAFAWISGDPKFLAAVLSDKNVCVDATERDCMKYQVLKLFESHGRGPEFTAKAFSNARRGPADLRSLWAALALEGAKNLAFRDRHVAIRIFRRDLNELDSLARTFVLPSITTSIPRAIAMNRREIRSVAPLLAKENYLVRRVEAIREIENAGMEAAKLPWARIRASVTNELADLYADTARSLKTLRGADPAWAEPFEKKSDALRTKAFEIASSTAIESESFDEIAQPYLHADPRRMARLIPKETIRKAEPLDPAQLKSLDPSGDWGAAGTSSVSEALKERWYHALRQKRWAEATYLVQYASQKKAVPVGTLALLRAYTLAGLGAQAEALQELFGARNDLEKRTRKNVNRLLLDHFRNSLAHDRAGALMKEIGADGDSVAHNGRVR